MKIDLNQPFTTKDIETLLASKDDSAHRQLRVLANWVAYLSDEVGADNIGGLAFRMETWSAGHDHVGNKAAKDPAWVARVERVLRNNWPTPTDTFIDVY